MKSKPIFFILLLALIFQFYNTSSVTYAGTSASVDLEKFVKEVYNLYQTDEVPVKKERMVYKKITETLLGSLTTKITCSDSIAYNKKEDITTVKSKEIYYADNMNGYFGIYVIFHQKGDALLMNTSPDKEITISGTGTEILVTLYRKGLDFFKCRTPIKEFDDSGTVIQQIILTVQG